MTTLSKTYQVMLQLKMNLKLQWIVEQEYCSIISSKLHKVTCIQVDRDKKEKMLKQFSIVKYKQFIPNWFVLFMKV